MAKTLSIERIAELFLYELRKQEKRPPKKNDGYLLSFLERKKIFYDSDILEKASTLLEEKGLMKPSEEIVANISFYTTAPKNVTVDELHLNWEHVKALERKKELTNKGRDFVDRHQKLDSQRIKQNSNRKKWIIGSIAVPLIGALMTVLWPKGEETIPKNESIKDTTSQIEILSDTNRISKDSPQHQVQPKKPFSGTPKTVTSYPDVDLEVRKPYRKVTNRLIEEIIRVNPKRLPYSVIAYGDDESDKHARDIMDSLVKRGMFVSEWGNDASKLKRDKIKVTVTDVIIKISVYQQD